jgi:hypothetical protein
MIPSCNIQIVVVGLLGSALGLTAAQRLREASYAGHARRTISLCIPVLAATVAMCNAQVLSLGRWRCRRVILLSPAWHRAPYSDTAAQRIRSLRQLLPCCTSQAA